MKRDMNKKKYSQTKCIVHLHSETKMTNTKKEKSKNFHIQAWKMNEKSKLGFRFRDCYFKYHT